MSKDVEFENQLRDMFAERARRAPESAALAERIVHYAPTRQVAPLSRRSWQTWTLPVIAAAAVAAIAVSLVVVNEARNTAGLPEAVPTPAPHATVHVSQAPQTFGTTSGTSSPAANNSLGLTNFVVTDLTFVSSDAGWALGSADCLSGAGTCTAMARTTDGRTWRSVPNPPVNVGGACASDGCATNIRFANEDTGYVFSQDLLYMTTDGGAHWTKQSGGAWALETLDNNVIRLVADHSGCPGPCNLRVELAPIGGTRWTTVTLPGATVDTGSVALSRSGSHAVIETFAGHASSTIPATLYLSSDDGHRWVQRDDPCTAAGLSAGNELTSAADGSFSVLCSSDEPGGQAIATSSDGGAHFDLGARFALGSSGVSAGLATPSSTVALVRAGDGIYRSTDGGGAWKRVIRDPSDGGGFCGFQSATVGRCTSNDGRSIYTTHDAGRTWLMVTFA